MYRVIAAVAILFVILLSSGCRAEDENPGTATISVFAAASLTDILEVFADSFETSVAGAPDVVLNLAGSSLLARQIEHGAGADIFVSAHPSWTGYLHDHGFLDAPVELPITNQLVLVSRGAGRRLADVERLALADPDHVPAGVYARKALECEDLWATLQGRTAATVDVRAALAAVEEGAADAAIVYESDARFTPNLHVADAFSAGCRPVITYTIGLAPSAGRGAELFAGYVLDTLRRTTWGDFGFTLRL